MKLPTSTRPCLLVVVAAAALLAPAITTPGYPNGVGYYITGGVIGTPEHGTLLEVPGQYRVIHVEKTSERLLVTAYFLPGAASEPASYRSEVWAFSLEPKHEGQLDFDSRRVLVALTGEGGEKAQVCQRTISSREGTAVYIQGWEHGRTMLFDRTGAIVDVDWPKAKPGGQCCVDFIVPLAWLEDWDPKYRCRLVCRMSEYGDPDPCLLTYDWHEGTFEVLSMTDALGKFGPELLDFMLRVASES